MAAHAQLTHGFFSGTVTDSARAPVPGVKIAMREQSTGIRLEGLTNEAGVYRFVGLEPGTYTLEYSKDGFESIRLEGILLSTAQEVVLNEALTVAGTATSITVEGSTAGALLSRATPTVERTLGREVISSVPLIGTREVSDLALLAPGTVMTGSDSTSLRYSTNGVHQEFNKITLDGMDNRDAQFKFVSFNSNPDSVNEVQIRTNSFSAEFGGGLGAHVSVLTRGGNNQFHGEVYDYYGADWMSAQTLANKYAGLPDVRFNEHQAGVNAGGPIRKDRTFFFVQHQNVSHREGISANGIAAVTIPTPSGYGVLEKVPLAAGQTPQARAEVLSSLSFLPEIYGQVKRYDSVRTINLNGVPVEFGTTRIGIVRRSDLRRPQLRLDHRLSDKDMLSYRFQSGLYAAPVALGWPNTNNSFGARFASSEDIRQQLHNLRQTHMFTTALVNELRLSASRRADSVMARGNSTVSTTVSGMFNLGPDPGVPFVRPRNSYEAQEILTWTRGLHSVKFGGHLIFLDDTMSGPQQSTWTFNAFPNFFNNRADSAVLRLRPFYGNILSIRQNYFVQDDFKIRPSLILNIGARYQIANVPEGLFGAATPEMVTGGVQPPVRPDRNDLAPRLGLAYSPVAEEGWLRRVIGDHATVVRGGFGVAYSLLYEQTSGFLGVENNYPYSTAVSLDASQLINEYPALPARAAPGFDPRAAYNNYATSGKNPATHFYAFSVQREFAGVHVVELGYMGSRTYHLNLIGDRNPASLTAEQAQRVIAAGNSSVIPGVNQRRLHPEWGVRMVTDSVGYSNYNAGYVKFDRRFSRGLLIGANYTWSKSLGVTGDPIYRVQVMTNLRADYSRTLTEVPHRFVIHYVWQTPGHRFVEGWRIAGVSMWQSGLPFSILTGVDSNGDGIAATDRPDYRSGGKLSLDPVTGNWRTFVTPIDGTGIVVTPLSTTKAPLPYSMVRGGNLGRGTFRSPAISLWNLSVAKPFRLSERVQMDIRADGTNFFNHRNFSAPENRINNVNFGRNLSSPPSRVMQLSMKVRF
ncbi:MAG: carboxypeptidase regulatory-like domain-containing protein [Bryobacterales bacterium]|nr:carboxypeptidase regulatory-like domain-containing protein [Bryobacterales bacterium]